jgi:hypothetical protein
MINTCFIFPFPNNKIMSASVREEIVPVLKVVDRIDFSFKKGRGAPTALGSGAQTITAAAIAGEVMTCVPGGAGTLLTLCTAQVLHDYIKPSETELTHDFFIINTDTTSANTGLVTTAAGWTLVGGLYVPAVGAPLVSGLAGAHFRVRWTAIGSSATATLYRLA